MTTRRTVCCLNIKVNGVLVWSWSELADDGDDENERALINSSVTHD